MSKGKNCESSESFLIQRENPHNNNNEAADRVLERTHKERIPCPKFNRSSAAKYEVQSKGSRNCFTMIY